MDKGGLLMCILTHMASIEGSIGTRTLKCLHTECETVNPQISKIENKLFIKQTDVISQKIYNKKLFPLKILTYSCTICCPKSVYYKICDNIVTKAENTIQIIDADVETYETKIFLIYYVISYPFYISLQASFL